MVDDNVDAAASLAILLGHMGHDVATAHDGLTAIGTARQFAPEFVFLDLGMPGMDGIETAYELRTLSQEKKMVLIALTGWGQPHDRDKTRAAGFDHHLLKPVEPSVLEGLLQPLSESKVSGASTR